MKKVLIIILSILLICPYANVYAEDGYSEWSTTPTGYPNEERAIQYGVITPKTWSQFNINEFTEQVLPQEPSDNSWHYNDSLDLKDHHFQITKDFGDYHTINDGDGRMAGAKAKTLYEYDFGEPKTIIEFYVDVDCRNREEDRDYVSPPLYFYADGELIAYEPMKPCDDHGGENFHRGNLNLNCQKVAIKMGDATSKGRNYTRIYWSYIKIQLIKHSHVIEWNEPSGWRFDEPYELLDDASRGVVNFEDNSEPISQIPVERVVYRYPINPTISIDKRYLYEDSTIDTIKELACAIDYNGDDISDKIVVTKIIYEDNEEVVYNPDYFDPYISDIIRVTYYVKNEIGGQDTKTVKLYILRDGETVDFKIYDRYISKDYIETLEDNSKWKNGECREILNDAINWLEGK